MTPLRELIEAVEKIHQIDIPGYAGGECIECGTDWPCDTAELLAEWKAAAGASNEL